MRSTGPLDRRASLPWGWRLAGVLELVGALALVLVLFLDPPRLVTTVGLLIWALTIAVLGAAVFLGRVWAYWPSVLFMFFLAAPVIFRAAGPGATELADAAFATPLVAAIVLLIWPSSQEARRRLEGAENQEVWDKAVGTPRVRRFLTLALVLVGTNTVMLTAAVEPTVRPIGLAVGLMAMAALLTMLSLSSQRRERLGIRLELIRHHERLEPALLFEVSQVFYQLLALGLSAGGIAALIVAAFADAFADRAGESVAGLRIGAIVATALLGGLAFSSLANLRRRPVLALLRHGILLRSLLGTSFIPWKAMAAAEPVTRSQWPVLGITLGDRTDVEVVGGSRLLRWNRAAAGVDLCLPLAMLEARPALVAQVVGHYLEHSQERDSIGLDLPPGLPEAKAAP